MSFFTQSGRTYVYTYDTFGGVSGIYPLKDSDAPGYELVYDDFGRVTQVYVKGENGYKNLLITNTYDEFGRILSKTYANGGTVGYTYDNIDRVVETRYGGDNAKTLRCYYNSRGQLTYVLDTVGMYRMHYVYDMAGRVVRTVRDVGLGKPIHHTAHNNGAEGYRNHYHAAIKGKKMGGHIFYVT